MLFHEEAFTRIKSERSQKGRNFPILRVKKWLRQLEHPKSFSSPQNISKQEDLSSKVANLAAFT